VKVLLVSTYDIIGGAARAAYRLHQGLRSVGCDSRMLVQVKAGQDDSVLGPRTRSGRLVGMLKPPLDVAPLSLCKRRLSRDFTMQLLPGLSAARLNDMGADVVNLHWVGGSFVAPEQVARIAAPLVWTLHDMWPFTGGCRYSRDCGKYRDNCGACPELGSRFQWDASRLGWLRKRRSWRDLQLTVVAPSRWLAECVTRSSLMREARVEVIPNGLNTSAYRPIDRALARSLLGLPLDVPLVAFGAEAATSDPRKGFAELVAAVRKLSAVTMPSTPQLVVFGGRLGLDLPLKTHALGRLNDELSLALVYSAADLFVAPSLQDNLPNTVLEALSCGAPVVAFRIGGMPDMVEHLRCGYLAQPGDTGDLAEGIRWVLADRERRAQLSRQSRDRAQTAFAQNVQARRYLELYSDLVHRAERN